MGDNFSNIVWTMSPKESSDYKAMNEDDFVKAVNHALDYGFGPHPQSSWGIRHMLSWLSKDLMSTDESFELPPKITRLVSQRMVFPLSLVHINSYTAKRVVLIGDAAHTVHPLAGQGVNMVFGDVVALSRVISECVALGADIGEIVMKPSSSLAQLVENQAELSSHVSLGL
ncbi:Putative ubiquinone biosynthesis monooxygenase [Ancistrocladus abbreviatus]